MTLKGELINLDIRTHENIDSLIEKMLDQIGSVDPELRDELIYSTFGELILNDHLTPKQMNHIQKTCLDKLFTEIGQVEDDSVFTRSFAALVITLILNKDRQKKFLSHSTLTDTFKSSLRYLRLEKDIRGHVDGKGWAHSIAHGADLLAECIRNPSFNIELSEDCLETIKYCLFKESIKDTPYIDDEEERLTFAIEALLEKRLSEEELTKRTSTILSELEESEDSSLAYYRKKSNVIHFYQALYFRLHFKNRCANLQKELISIIKRMHEEVYG